jgi:hypothetical protein
MRSELYEQQYMLCLGCGKTKVWGKEADRVKHGLMNREDGRPGLTEEDAIAYIREYPDLYFDCPDGGHAKFEMVPFDQLEHGAYYTGHCRNAAVARWDAEREQFVYLREKFDQRFLEEIRYWVEALPGQHKFDEFKPYFKLDNPPFEIRFVVDTPRTAPPMMVTGPFKIDRGDGKGVVDWK